MEHEKIGRYMIERELGRGGQSIVYLASDPAVERRVAIKVLPRQFTFDEGFRDRFQREARVIAALEHPAIVPIYDFGEQDGQPYIVMRYMPNGTLAQRIAGGPLTLERSLTIVQRTAQALDRAHGAGIVHRDLKPGNILFDQYDTPYLADFGIVKMLDGQTLTATGLIGTPAYMSPEQARGERSIDGRSDVYALGVILFEMLTGRALFEADTPMGVLVAHMIEPPPDITAISPDLPAGVQVVLANALTKRPEDRLATAGALAAALEAAARGADSGLRLPPTGALSGPPTGVLPGVAAPTTTNPGRVTVQLPGSDRPFNLPLPVLLLVVIALLLAGLWLGDAFGMRQIAAPASAPQQEMQQAAELPQALQVLSMEQAGLRLLERHELGVNSVDFSPDGAQLVSGGSDNAFIVWDIADGEPLLQINEPKGTVNMVRWSPDGRWIASASNDQIALIVDARTGDVVRRLEGHTSAVYAAVWSPDSRLLATTSADNLVIIWDAATGEPLHTLRGHTNWVWTAAFSPDGQVLVSAGSDRRIIVWDVQTGARIQTLGEHESVIWALAFSHDGARLASADADGVIYLWDTGTWGVTAALRGHTERVEGLAWSPDGTRLASASSDRSVIVWSLPEGQPLEQVAGFPEEVNAVTYSPDGRLLALGVGAGMSPGQVLLWETG